MDNSGNRRGSSVPPSSPLQSFSLPTPFRSCAPYWKLSSTARELAHPAPLSHWGATQHQSFLGLAEASVGTRFWSPAFFTSEASPIFLYLSSCLKVCFQGTQSKTNATSSDCCKIEYKSPLGSNPLEWGMDFVFESCHYSWVVCHGLITFSFLSDLINQIVL